MRPRGLIPSLLVCTLALFVVAACGDEGGGERRAGPEGDAGGWSVDEPVDEQAPDAGEVEEADAGSPAVVDAGREDDCVEIAAEASFGHEAWSEALVGLHHRWIDLRPSPQLPGATYRWTVVERPAGSTSRLDPTDTVAAPRFLLDRVGLYVFRVEIVDEEGRRGCDSAIVSAHAQYGAILAVELSWEASGTPGPSDAARGDVDLHFLHPAGRWNHAPYDIFWNNVSAGWGPPGPSGDPSLDIDDDGGVGREVVLLGSPESDLTYEVGVYHFDDAGLGGSDATIRIFVSGVLRAQMTRRLESTGDFWHVARIAWPEARTPNQGITGVGAVTRGFPGAVEGL